MPLTISGPTEIVSGIAEWLATHPDPPTARAAVQRPKHGPADVAFAKLLYGCASAIRDAHPNGYVVATLDGIVSPMRLVGFGDMHRDSLCENPSPPTQSWAMIADAIPYQA